MMLLLLIVISFQKERNELSKKCARQLKREASDKDKCEELINAYQIDSTNLKNSALSRRALWQEKLNARLKGLKQNVKVTDDPNGDEVKYAHVYNAHALCIDRCNSCYQQQYI